MLKVWISGANGHLGQALCTRLDREKYQLIATDVEEVDVTVPAEVRAFAAVSYTHLTLPTKLEV